MIKSLFTSLLKKKKKKFNAKYHKMFWAYIDDEGKEKKNE